MKTWSAEELFIRAYAAGAVAAQGVWDVVKGVEKLTKPPRRTGFDEDAAGEFLAVSPDHRCVECLKPIWWDNEWEKWYHTYDNSPACAHADDDAIAHLPGQHTPSDRLCVYTAPDGVDSQAICGVCRPVRDIVEQMIEERYGDQSERADTQDAQMWRAFVDPDSPAASAAGDSPSDACDIPPSPSEGRPTSELLTRAAVVIDISAGIASTLGYYNEATGTQLDAFSAELRDRAATFTDIEQSK